MRKKSGGRTTKKLNTKENDMRVFCVNCGQKCSYSEETSQEEISVRGISFSYLERSAFCTACGEEVYVPAINDDNVRRREDAYNKAKKIYAPPYQGYRHEYMIPQSQADICSTSDPDEWRKSYPQNLEVRFDKDSPIILRHRSIKHDPQA